MRRPVNVAASVRARLLNLARERNQPFQLLLTRNQIKPRTVCTASAISES